MILINYKLYLVAKLLTIGSNLQGYMCMYTNRCDPTAIASWIALMLSIQLHTDLS